MKANTATIYQKHLKQNGHLSWLEAPICPTTLEPPRQIMDMPNVSQSTLQKKPSQHTLLPLLLLILSQLFLHTDCCVVNKYTHTESSSGKFSPAQAEEDPRACSITSACGANQAKHSSKSPPPFYILWAKTQITNIHTPSRMKVLSTRTWTTSMSHT